MPSAAIAAPAQPHVVAATTGGDWTQFRHDAGNSGYNAAENVISVSNVAALGVAWKGAINPTGAASYRIIESSPAVANGVVYVGSRNNGELFAYAVGCGSGGSICQPLWTATTDNWWIASSPAVYDGVVYVEGAGNHLYAFDAAGSTDCGGSPKTCSPLWTANLGSWNNLSSPTFYDGVVYVGSADNNLYAFDAAACKSAGGTCAPLWHGPTGGAIRSSPAVAPPVSGGNPVVYVGSEDGKLYAWDAVACAGAGGSCAPLWTAHPDGGVLYSPVVANGVVYMADGNWYIDAYDAAGSTNCSGSPKTCTALWKGAGVGSGIRSTPAVANGVVYFEASQYLFAMAAGDGLPLWFTNMTSAGFSSLSPPSVANGVLYAGDSNGDLYAWDAAGVIGYDAGSLSPLWSYTIGTAIEDSPAVSNGVVYVGSDDGYLYAFGLPLDHLVLSPADATVAAGVSQAYTAEGFDAHGNSLGDVTGATTFTIGGTGSCTGASCTSTAAGDHTVTGSDGTATGTATLHVDPAAATTLVVSGLTTPRTAGSTGSVTVTALDPYGNTDTGYGGTVHFTSSDGAAVLPADAALTAGIGTFSVTLKTAGPQSVTATDTGNSSITGVQNGIVVNAAAATTLVVSGLTTPRTAGTTGSIRVTATDASGNRVHGYLGTVKFTSSDTKAKLPANYKFTAADAGTHVFSGAVILKTAGTQSVTATDTVTASIHGSQSGIVVTAAALSKLVVSGLTTARTAGSTGSIRVTAVDAYGNRIHSYLGTVHFTSSDAKAKLPASYKFTAADAGTHVFTVILKTAGTQSVTATDTVTKTIKGSQAGIVVKAAAVKTLIVSGLTTPRTKGVAGTIRVTAVDAYGNRVSGYTGTVHFTSSDAKAKLPANYKFKATDAGTHVFTVTLKTAGTQSVRATDKVTATITGVEKGIVVK